MEITTKLLQNYFKHKLYLDGLLEYPTYYSENDPNLEIALTGKVYEEQFISDIKEQVKNLDIKSTSKYYTDVTLSNLPSYITNPPPMRSDIITYNTVLGYTPIESKYAYLQNFKIDFDWVDTTPIDNNHLSIEKQKSNIIRGQKKMFQNQVRTRGSSPMQALLISVLTYRCDDCYEALCQDKQYSHDCRCYLKSAAIVTLIRLIGSSSKVPFQITKQNFTVKNTGVPHISSVLPSLWYALCDLAIRSRLGCIDNALETHIVNDWLLVSEGSFHGSVLGKFKDIKYTTAKLRSNKTFVAPDYDGEFHITGAHKVFIDKIDVPVGYYDSWIKSFSVDSMAALHMMYQLQHVSPSILVTGSIELIISSSAQATNPINFIPQRITEYTDVGLPYRIPSKIAYEDEDILMVREIIMQGIRDNPPDLSDLQSRFIEVATTNSAGLGPEERKQRTLDIKRMYGSGEDADMIGACAGIRLFDVLILIRDSLQSWEQFIGSWDAENTSGLRYQIGRRVRLIQMLRSVYMMSPFLIKEVLEPSIKDSEITASGKTTNDIRDAYAQCVGSSISIRCNSDDVVGMDTSTHKMQTAFITNCVLDYLASVRDTIGPFFVRDSNFVNVTRHVVHDDNTETLLKERISVVEGMVLLDNYPSNQPRQYRAGFFSRQTYSSNIAFESGTYKTSIQHTRLLSAIYKAVKNIFERKYASVGFRATISVLGDDQFSFTVSIGSQDDILTYAVEFRDRVESILHKFGYKTDSTFEKGFGEFLKQVAVCGVLIPFSVRLSQFSSERGEQGSVVDRIRNMFGVADELSARVPYSQGIVGYKYAIAMVLGCFGMSQEFTPVDLKKLVASSGMSHVWVTPNYVFCVGRRLWYCSLQFGLPFPKDLHPQGSFLTFPSPAVCRRILDYAKRDYPVMEKMSVISRIRLLPTILKLYWTQLYRLRGSDFIESLFASSDNFLPLTLTELYDSEALVFHGFYDGYMLAKYSRGDSKRLEFGAGFKELQQLGNSYLDPHMVNVSHLATYRLASQGITVSDSFTYYNRSGARLESVVQTLHLTEGKKLAISSMVFDMVHQRSKTLNDFVKSLGYGAYHVELSDGVKHLVDYSCYDRGLGPCVPPASIQSMYIDSLGLPKKSDYDLDAVKKGLESMMNIPGVSDVVLKFMGECYNRGGTNALELAFDSIGVSQSLRLRVYKLLESIGFGTAVMPYAMSPRKFFYYCTSKYSGNSVNYHQAFPSYNTQVEWAMYISEIAADHTLLSKGITIQFGHKISRQL